MFADIVDAGYYLNSHVEHLTLEGATTFGVGNALANALTGGVGANVLLAGDGDDTLNGGRGADVLSGEAGRDLFIFERGTGGDAIGDFTPGVDRIRPIGFGQSDFAPVRAALVEHAGTAALALGDGDLVAFTGVPVAALGPLISPSAEQRLCHVAHGRYDRCDDQESECATPSPSPSPSVPPSPRRRSRRPPPMSRRRARCWRRRSPSRRSRGAGRCRAWRR